MPPHYRGIGVTVAAAGLALAGFTRESQADLVIAAPVVVPTDNTQVIVEFIDADTPLTGDLYFRGSGTQFSLLDPVADTGPTAGLGQFLYRNQDGGAPIVLGVFDAGDVLHFAYQRFPLDIPQAIFLTDNPPNVFQFAYDAATGLYAVDDLEPAFTDLDYDDIEVRFVFQTVPAPGAAALLGLGLLSRRRRRRAD